MANKLEEALLNRIMKDNPKVNKSGAIAIAKDKGWIKQGKGDGLEITEKGKQPARNALEKEEQD